MVLLNHLTTNSRPQGEMDQRAFYGGPAGGQNMPLGNALYNTSADREELGDFEKSKRKLAKRANEIYRSVCNELELGECFFRGFGAWSEFVEGKINETSFYERAKEEAQLLATMEE